MAKRNLQIAISFILIILAQIVPAQSHNLFGKIIDETNESTIENVNITLIGTDISSSSDSKGEFKFHLQRNRCNLKFSHISYETRVISIDLSATEGDSVIIVKLHPQKIDLGEVFIVSTKSIRKYSEAALPLEVITGNEIQKYKPQTVSDILSNKPGLSLQRDGIWATGLSIRGLHGSDIIILVDGNRIETATDLDGALSLFNLDDIRQIEVIKNASSVLYGSGALGGIINIITDAGTYTDNFVIKGRINSGINSVNDGFSNGLSMALSDKNWTMNISGSYRNAGNTQTPSGELTNSGYSDDYFSATLGFFLNGNNKFKITYQNFKGWDIGIPGGLGLFPSKAVVKYSFVKRDLFEFQYSVKNIIKPLKEFTIKFFNQNIYRFVDNNPGQTTIIPPVDGKPEQIISVDKIAPSARHYVTGLQVQSNWLIGSNLLIAGIDAWQRNLDSRREKYIIHSEKNSLNGNVTRDFEEVLGEKPLPNSSFRSIGFYAQNEIPVIQGKLKLTAGVRADQVYVKNDSVSNPMYYYTIPPGMKNEPPSILYWKGADEMDFSWSSNINILYNLSKETSLTFSYSHSFRSASLEERYKYIDLGSVIRLGNPELKPEKGNYLDAGMRYFNDDFHVYANVYVNFLTDQIIETPGIFEGRKAFLSVNAGRSRLYGFDGAADLKITDNSSIKISAAYVIGKDLSSGSNLPGIPPLNGSIGYNLGLSQLFSCELKVTVFSSQDRIAPGELATPGYVYYSFYISGEPLRVMSAKLTAYAGCENILDKSYRNHLSSNRGIIVSEPGRNFFLKLSLTF